MNQQTFSIILDFESTGVDTNTARPIELGVMLVDSKTWKEEAAASYLLWDKDYPELTEEVEKLTSILHSHVSQVGVKMVDALADLSEAWSMYLPLVDFIVAYNRDYDEVLMKNEAKRVDIKSTPAGNCFLNKPWLCAMRDVEENMKYKCLKLSHLALDHGVPVDPSVLHRAMGDVRLTQQMLAKLAVPANDIYTYQCTPSVAVQALIPAPYQDGGKGKELAVKRGYSWEVPRGTQEKYDKAWVKKIKLPAYDKEVCEAPFKVRKIGG